MSARALIFHMSIPCDKAFPCVSLFFNKYWSFYIANEHFLEQDLPTGIKIFGLVIMTIFEIGHYQGHLCFTNTSCYICFAEKLCALWSEIIKNMPNWEFCRIKKQEAYGPHSSFEKPVQIYHVIYKKKLPIISFVKIEWLLFFIWQN